MRELKLTNSNKIALIDDEDYERCCLFSWRVVCDRTNSVGRQKCTNYGLNKSTYQALANYIMLDRVSIFNHKNRNGLDNQKENLRPCTNSLNSANRAKSWGNNKYKGVSKDSNRFQAAIMKDGKKYFLGSFILQRAAALAYDKKAKELFGEFAVLNFPV